MIYIKFSAADYVYAWLAIDFHLEIHSLYSPHIIKY